MDKALFYTFLSHDKYIMHIYIYNDILDMIRGY